MAQGNSEDFPWEIGVFDAHCHPTDTMSSIAEIPRMKATTLTIMATRGEDQDLVLQTARTLTKATEASDIAKGSHNPTDRVLPCFGWHPWFSHQIIDDTSTTSKDNNNKNKNEDNNTENDEDPKTTHYKTVLKPVPDTTYISTLPPPKPLSQLLTETRARLQSFPHALVGEIGLDRAFRLPAAWTQRDLANRDGAVTPGSREGRRLSPYQVKLEHQRAVLEAQLRLAGELGRPVSVHSVQAHGVVFELFKALWRGHERVVPSRRERRRRHSVAEAHAESDAEDAALSFSNGPGNEKEAEKKARAKAKVDVKPFPPRICMHSYSGPVEQVKQFLHPSNPSDVYFSFSSVINFGHAASSKAVAVIKALPDDRVLIESDLHVAGERMDEVLEEVARQVCEIRGWELREGVRQLAENFRRFVHG